MRGLNSYKNKLMKKTRIAINGFGRIGRLIFRKLSQKEDVEIVAVNDLTENALLAHLLKYDTAHGTFDAELSADDKFMYCNGHKIATSAIRNPEELPWKELDIDYVFECTGVFRTKEKSMAHLKAGAKNVLISAPAKGGDVTTVVLGVNEEVLNNEEKILSNASCTTNCLAPMVKVLDDNFGIVKGFVTTIHAYTADQNLQDGPHSSDYRRARAAAANLVPTTTNAAKAVELVLPELKGKLFASAVRVPVLDGSLTELNCLLNKEVSVEDVNRTFQKAAEGDFKGLLEYVDAPLVSSDIVGNPHSAIFDAQLTQTSGDFIKIVAWYDNEFGYASRMVDLLYRLLGK